MFPRMFRIDASFSTLFAIAENRGRHPVSGQWGVQPMRKIPDQSYGVSGDMSCVTMEGMERP